MNADMLLIGAGVMTVTGAIAMTGTKDNSYTSWIAVGLGLMWMSLSVK
jgi:hypothetical protein